MAHENNLRRGVAYLSQAQNRDGGFDGLASPSASDFSQARRHPTIFFTALILAAVREVGDSLPVRQRAADFLLHHRSPAWSWNYWVRDHRADKLRSYPDDLDDTMCALAALHGHDSGLIDGTVLAEVARQLIAAEQAPGGPYRTWLVEPDAPAVWRDVDIAVNANIGFFLWRQDVKLPALEAYIADAIERGELLSPYYCGIAPTLYFLARWYRGAGAERLRRLVIEGLQPERGRTDALTLALLTVAAARLGVPLPITTPAVRRLQQLQDDDGSWPATGLYYEPPIGGVRHYAGSPALTTAICLEALTVHRHNRPKPATSGLKRPRQDTVHGLVLEQALGYVDATGDQELRELYRRQLTALAARDHDRQVTGMATATALASGRLIDAETLLHLNTASLQGWLAYTIYDDIWDNEGDVRLLGIANLALRHCLESFTKAVPGPAFCKMTTQALEWVDGANTWEAVQARARVSGSSIRIAAMPDYGDYRQLARRSWGHSLAGRGVLLAAGNVAGDQSLLALERFFHHFLIAKQLSDDAHDWQEDLRHGRITAVVALLLGGYPGKASRVRLSGIDQKLGPKFWSETIVQVASLVHAHVETARQALESCPALADPGEFHGWLDRLALGASQALKNRAHTQQFIARYRRPTRVS